MNKLLFIVAISVSGLMLVSCDEDIRSRGQCPSGYGSNGKVALNLRDACQPTAATICPKNYEVWDTEKKRYVPGGCLQVR